jgi:hypothetical protein
MINVFLNKKSVSLFFKKTRRIKEVENNDDNQAVKEVTDTERIQSNKTQKMEYLRNCTFMFQELQPSIFLSRICTQHLIISNKHQKFYSIGAGLNNAMLGWIIFIKCVKFLKSFQNKDIANNTLILHYGKFIIYYHIRLCKYYNIFNKILLYM